MAIQPPSVDPLEGHEKYRTKQYLSAGSSGFVVLADDMKNGKEVAVKFLERSQEKISKNLEREILNHSSLVHPHIIQFREAFLTDKYLAIAMEYAPGGNLFSYVRDRHALSEEHARWFYQQLVLGLDYCHKKGISIRDIKLENTLLDTLDSNRRPLLKMCDFGYSINENHSDAKTGVGTFGYIAPEVFTNRCKYDGKLADVWSSGVMLYAMLFCEYPFEREEDENDTEKVRNDKVLQRILKAEYSYPQHKHVSELFKDLLSKILKVDPKEKFTIAGIWRHSWFREGMPANLDLDLYNDHYLKITEAEQLVEAIKEVVHDATGAPRGDEAHFKDDDLDEI